VASLSLSEGGAQFFVAGSIGTNTTKSTWQQQKERRFAASAESRSFPITRCKSIARKSAGSITTDLAREDLQTKTGNIAARHVANQFNQLDITAENHTAMRNAEQHTSTT